MSKFLILASLFLAQAEADFSAAFLESVAEQQIKEPELLLFSCRLKATNPAGAVSYGSATLTKEGILTCEHCVRDAVSLEVEYLGQSVPARIVKSDRAMDVALLQPATAGATSKWPQASLALQPVIAGESLFSCGRNAAGLLGVERHKVTLAGTKWDVRREFEYTNAPTRGRSGGGLFNARGELVGLARAERMDLHHGGAVCVESIRQALAENAPLFVGSGQKLAATIYVKKVCRPGDLVCQNCVRQTELVGDGDHRVAVTISTEQIPSHIQQRLDKKPGGYSFPVIVWSGGDGTDWLPSHSGVYTLDQIVGMMQQTGAKPQ